MSFQKRLHRETPKGWGHRNVSEFRVGSGPSNFRTTRFETSKHLNLWLLESCLAAGSVQALLHSHAATPSTDGELIRLQRPTKAG